MNLYQRADIVREGEAYDYKINTIGNEFMLIRLREAQSTKFVSVEDLFNNPNEPMAIWVKLDNKGNLVHVIR